MYGVGINLDEKKIFIHRVIKREEKIRGGGTDFNDLIQGKKRGECTESNLWCDLQSINISNQINHSINQCVGNLVKIIPSCCQYSVLLITNTFLCLKNKFFKKYSIYILHCKLHYFNIWL